MTPRPLSHLCKTELMALIRQWHRANRWGSQRPLRLVFTVVLFDTVILSILLCWFFVNFYHYKTECICLVNSDDNSWERKKNIPLSHFHVYKSYSLTLPPSHRRFPLCFVNFHKYIWIQICNRILHATCIQNTIHQICIYQRHERFLIRSHRRIIPNLSASLGCLTHKHTGSTWRQFKL